MGCCGQREKGVVSEQQKWDYIVCDKTSHHDAGRHHEQLKSGRNISIKTDVEIFLIIIEAELFLPRPDFSCSLEKHKMTASISFT